MTRLASALIMNRRAGLTICAHAVDAEEAAELLGMLGLIETWRVAG